MTTANLNGTPGDSAPHDGTPHDGTPLDSAPGGSAKDGETPSPGALRIERLLRRSLRIEMVQAALSGLLAGMSRADFDGGRLMLPDKQVVSTVAVEYADAVIARLKQTDAEDGRGSTGEEALLG